MYNLFVIPGSHACRSAMLMLEHKQVPYRRVDIVTLLHPLVVRLRGFDAGGQTRNAGGRRTLGLRVGDRLGTVPALAANAHRISTNNRIARFLDEHHPEPPLFLGAAVVRDPAAFSRWSGDGRMGYLLYKRRSRGAWSSRGSSARPLPLTQRQTTSFWLSSPRCSTESMRGSPTGSSAPRN